MTPEGFFNQTITVAERSANDRYGRGVFSAGTDNNARVKRTSKSKLLPNGEVITILGLVHCRGDLDIKVGDKLTYEEVDYKVYSKSEAIDGEGGINHLKLELTEWLETS